MGNIIGLDKPLTNWDAEPFAGDEWIDNGHGDMNRIPTGLHIQSYSQWEFQEPKLEVATIYKAYFFGLNFREYPQKIWPYMVLTYLHFRILRFPLIQMTLHMTQAIRYLIFYTKIIQNLRSFLVPKLPNQKQFLGTIISMNWFKGKF